MVKDGYLFFYLKSWQVGVKLFNSIVGCSAHNNLKGH